MEPPGRYTSTVALIRRNGMSTKPYYDRYFPDGLVDGSFSVEYLLCIWLSRDVTSEMLEEVGLILDDEDGDVLGDYVLDGDQIVVQLFLPNKAGDINGKGDELPHGWEQDVPAMIGLKPEWVDDLEWMTGE